MHDHARCHPFSAYCRGRKHVSAWRHGWLMSVRRMSLWRQIPRTSWRDVNRRWRRCLLITGQDDDLRLRLLPRRLKLRCRSLRLKFVLEAWRPGAKVARRIGRSRRMDVHNDWRWCRSWSLRAMSSRVRICSVWQRRTGARGSVVVPRRLISTPSAT